MTPYSCDCFNVLLLGVAQNGTSISIAQDTLLLTNWQWPSLTISIFLNHFQLPMRYDTGTELVANFEQTTTDHIFDHIQEWRRWKSLIKVPVPPAFLFEWFLKSLVAQLSKDVATSRVFSEEDSIMRAQYFELIYSQCGLLYTIMLDAPRSILDKTRQRVGPHADGIVGSTQTKPVE
jgi:hypothetical protein